MYIIVYMTSEEFEQIVIETIKELPKKFRDQLDNVAITIEEWPTYQDLRAARTRPGSLLFGLYRGIPKTQRGSFYSSLPDKIVIFAGPILTVTQTEEEIKKQIKSTVLHEIGHHFGMSESEIRRAQRQ